MRKIRKKLKKLEWFGVFSIIMTVVWIIVLSFPVYWGFLSSTKDSLEAQRRPPKFWFVQLKNYDLYFDTTDIPDYDEDDFLYEAGVVNWMLTDRNLKINLNKVTVHRVENGKVISSVSLKYDTYTYKYKYNLFSGRCNQEQVTKWREAGGEKYELFLRLMMEDGYQTGMSLELDTSAFVQDEYTTTVDAYIAEQTDPNNQYISDYERITVEMKYIGSTYEGRWSTLFRNYIMAWGIGTGTDSSYARALLNSLILAGGSIFFQFIFSSVCGYGLSQLVSKKTAGRLIATYLMSMVVPSIMTQIPLYIAITSMKLLDTYLAIWLPTMASATNILLFKAFFDQMPKELNEAAKVDGANELFIFWKLYVPLSLPIYTTIALSTFTASWGQVVWPNLVLISTKKMPFPVILYRSMSAGAGGAYKNYPYSLAMGFISAIPTAIIFLFMQRQMKRGLTMGAVKG